MRRLEKTVRDDCALAQRLDLLVSIKGIGLRSALCLIIRMPELGHASRAEIAALAGLAPLTTTAASIMAGGVSRAVANACARACSCAHSQQPGTIPTWQPSMHACAATANNTCVPSSPWPANSSSSPTPSSFEKRNGRRNTRQDETWLLPEGEKGGVPRRLFSPFSPAGRRCRQADEGAARHAGRRRPHLQALRTSLPNPNSLNLHRQTPRHASRAGRGVIIWA